MAETYHVVEAGEYMEMIAERFGFRDYHVIYDHAKNQAFKTLRPNPHILYPGDRIFIPDVDPGQEPAETDKKHKFVVKAQKITLILYIRRNGKPVANQNYKLTAGTQTITGNTGANGLIQKEIAIGVGEGLLTLAGPPSYTRKLNIGFLHPITTISGKQMRLNNLGFGCGTPTGAVNDDYESALLSFQRKYKMTPSGKADEATVEKLRAEYDLGIAS